MRVELRVEEDEHETAVTVECDRAVDVDDAVDVAGDTLRRLRLLRGDTGG